MIRIVLMSGKYYGVELSEDSKKEMKEVRQFAEDGVPVIIVESLEDLEKLGIYDNITMVKRQD